MKITWLGHSTVVIDTDQQQRLIIDPWLGQNPACPDAWKAENAIGSLDLILLTHAHFDHIADAIPLARATGAQVVGIFELCHWLTSKGVSSTNAMNKGGTIVVNGITITMVHADHSCGIMDGDGGILYGGEAVGYVLVLPDGTRLYHAGDTAVFGDMKIIADLYHPSVAMLPIGDHFTMSPREAAYACGLLRPDVVLPLHHGTFPLLTGTPAALSAALVERGDSSPVVATIAPGQSIDQTGHLVSSGGLA